jgi:hypothetical protein
MLWVCLFWFGLLAQAEPFAMNDVGGTLHLPKGWKAKEWSNWDFEAKSGDEAILLRLWLTEYQVPINQKNADVWGPDYIERLKKMGGLNATIAKVKLVDKAGRPTALTNLEFTFGGKKGGAGFARVAAFGGQGQTIHIRVVSNARNKKRASEALNEMLQQFELEKGPAKTGDSAVSAEGGFTAVLPMGWRPPLPKEKNLVKRFTDQLWSSKTGTEGCWVGIRPAAIGEPDVIFACKKYWAGGPLDAHSFDAIATELKTFFFGQAEVLDGESVSVGDRVGVYFRPKDGAHPLRLLTAPYDKGLMVMWGRGGVLDGVGLDAAMKAIAPTVKFTGPDGGHPVIRLDKQVGYYLAHRPTSPVVFGPAIILIGLIGFGVFRMRKRAAAPDAWDDATEV